jgi:serine/threonine protein kinase
VFPTPEQSYLSTCPVCQNQIDVTSLEPFTKLKCPFCGQLVRVRRKFDHFMIVKQIGEGGMSRVFEAEDETLGRRVALKILNQRFSRDEGRIEQFRQEALITANVNHPNVIKLYSVGYDQGYFYIAMELVDGGNLEQRIRREGRVKEADALKIGLEVAEGLRAAQQMGLIHRDVKPANILFTETGTAKVVDFGLAIFVDRGGDNSGEIWATPYYVAPEKVLDNREDYRSDIFSLGATLYHAMTGKPPHKADTDSIEQLRMIKCRRVALEDSGMRFAPRTIHAINRMLAFRPQERCANYDETVDELRLAEGLLGQSYATRWRLTNRRVRWGLTAAAMLALVFIIGWLVQFSGMRKAAAITQKVDTSRSDLTGDGVMLQAGNKGTVAERFIAARALMLEKRRFAEAHSKFERLLGEDLRQPTQNWARVNAALCSIMLGKKDSAGKYLCALASDTGNGGSMLVSPELANFFGALGKSFAQMPPGKSLSDLGYATSNEAIMGYLVHGLAEWNFGDARLGAALMSHFKQHLNDLNGSESQISLEWIRQCVNLVQPFEMEMTVVADLKEPAQPKNIEDCQQALARLRTKREQLKTASGTRALIEKWESSIRRELSRFTLDQNQQQITLQHALRTRELAQWTEILATIPSLIDGYDFTRVTTMLRDMRFESPEVQNAIDGQKYLYSQATAFLTRLFSDLKTEGGFTGLLVRHSGSSLQGRLVSASMESASVALERGTITLPLTDLAPQTLLDVAQYFSSATNDSTEYYQRQEEIAAFARAAGMPALSATVAAQLMEENRSFRQRWLKLSQ